MADRRDSRWKRRFLLPCLALLFAVGCTSHEDDEVVIGMLHRLDVSDGLPAVRSAELAVAHLDAAGGILIEGRRYRLRLLVEDTGDNPEDATRAALRLINQEQVVALVGPSRSRNAIPVAQVAAQADIPVVSVASTAPATTAGNPYSFRVNFTDPFQGRGMALFARDALGAASAAILYDLADTFSRSMKEIFAEAFRTAGGEIVAAESYTTGSADWESELLRIRDADPEVLFLPGFAEDVVPQAVQARSLGIAATFLGADGWITPLAAQPVLEGAYMPISWHHSRARDGRAKTFVDAYVAAHGEVPRFAAAAQAYDAVGVIARAIADTGSFDPESIRRGLAHLVEYDGATGEITYRGTDGDPPKRGLILQLRGGEVHFVQELGAVPGV